MLNQCVLVGRVKEMPRLQETVNGNKVASLLLEVERSFKTSDGFVEKDVFSVQLWRGIAETCCEVCVPGSLVGIKGRLQSFNVKKEDNTFYNAEVIAERVSFLDMSSKQQAEKQNKG